MIFGDGAKDVAGLQAYARLMDDVIRQHHLPTYIIAPPADLSSPDNPALLLKVWPTEEAARMITPDQWDHLIEEMSSTHCPDGASSQSARAGVPSPSSDFPISCSGDAHVFCQFAFLAGWCER